MMTSANAFGTGGFRATPRGFGSRDANFYSVNAGTGNPIPQAVKNVLGTAAGAAAVGGAKKFGDSISAGKSVDQALSEAAKEAAKVGGEAALGAVTDTISNITGIDVVIGTPDTPAGGGGGAIKFSDEQQLAGGRNMVGRLDYATSPIETMIDTDIDPNVYTSIYEEWLTSPGLATTYYTPTAFTMGAVQLPTDTSRDLYSFINTAIQSVFYNAVQRAVSFSVNATYVNTTNLIGSLNATMFALQVYLFFDSVLAYTANPLNRNAGMIAIRQNLTSTDLYNLSNLRYVLSGIPIPPNARLLCYWISQTYKNSPMPLSTIIKQCPCDMVANTAGNFFPDSGSISSALDALNSYNNTYSLLARACPKWIVPNMPSSNSAPLHDADFMTWFSNTPVYVEIAGDVHTYPQFTDSPYYSSFTEDLDGIVTALGAFYTSGSVADGNLVYAPSLYSVLPTEYSAESGFYNQWAYTASTGGFKPIYATQEIATGVGFTNNYSIIDTTNFLYQVCPIGAEPVYNFSEYSTYQTALEAAEWLFSIDSIGIIEGRQAYGKEQPRRRRKGRKSGGKSKGDEKKMK